MTTERQTSVTTKIKLPSLYRVVLHNDDKTPFDFVIELIIILFNKSYSEATQLAYKIHNEGSAVCGVYSKDIAETKVKYIERAASQYGYPLKSTMEVH